MEMETLVNRIEQYCLTQKIEISDKANLIVHALDDSIFTVVQRELTDMEWTNYDAIKAHLLKRVDVQKEISQKRLLFRQTKPYGAQTLEEFYTHLLGLAAKAFPEEISDTADRMITDQFILGCEVDRTRLHLIEKDLVRQGRHWHSALRIRQHCDIMSLLRTQVRWQQLDIDHLLRQLQQLNNSGEEKITIFEEKIEGIVGMATTINKAISLHKNTSNRISSDKNTIHINCQ